MQNVDEEENPFAGESIPCRATDGGMMAERKEKAGISVEKRKSGEKKDTIEKEFLGFPDVAADVINVLLYQGEEVVDSDNLVSGPTETIYQGLEKLRSQYEDLCKYEIIDGRINLMYLIANQTKADGKFLLRKAGYTGGIYREQYDEKMPNLFPVVELVLYWGKPRWRSNRDIRSIFRRRKISETTWKYIDEMKAHIFEMRHLPGEIRKLFKSDMRIVVDFLAEGNRYCSDRKVKHKAALIKMIKTLSGEEVTEGEVEKWLEECQMKEEDEVKVCELFDQYERKGRAEGRIEGRAVGHAEGRTEGHAEGKIDGKREDIIEFLKDLGEIPKMLREIIFGEKDIEVLKRWLKLAANAESIEEFQKAM